LPERIRGMLHADRTSVAPAPAPGHGTTLPLRSDEDRELYQTLVSALRDTEGNVSETARRMGKARQQIQKWLRRFGIDPASFRAVR